MAGPSEPEHSSSKPAFRLSDYRDGFFQPNGQFSRDTLMSRDAIASWEEQNHKIFEGKAWGAGQALFFGNHPLVFGRQRDLVDVVVDADPDQNGNVQHEMGVSRKHFELVPPTTDGKISIKDLGSTNGVKIFYSSGQTKAELNRSNSIASLEIGDFALIGGGKEDPTYPEHKSRLIGFRVCKDAAGKVFLVKFNAHDLGDLLGLIGKTESDSAKLQVNPARQELVDYPGKQEIEEAYHFLLTDMRTLREQSLQEKRNEKHLLATYQQLFSNIFRLTGEIGTRFYEGEWTFVAGLIGKCAMDEGRKFLEAGDKQTAAPMADLALLMMDFATNKLIQFTKE